MTSDKNGYKAAKSVSKRLSAALLPVLLTVMVFTQAALTAGCGTGLFAVPGGQYSPAVSDGTELPWGTWGSDGTDTPEEAGTYAPWDGAELTETEKAFWKRAEENLDYYCEIALGSEFGDADRKVHKWTAPVALYVYPSDDAENYKEFLDAHIGTLNGISGFPGIVLAETPETAALTLEFVTAEEMKTVTGRTDETAYGFVKISWYKNEGRIFKANVYIVNESGSSASDVMHTLTEETTQAMGLMNDSLAYPDSIFYEGYSTASNLSETDRLLLMIHYSPYINAGMSEEEVRAAVQRLAN